MKGVNTFLGMDADLSPDLQKPNTYMYGENFRLIIDKENNYLQINSGKGPKLIAYSDVANIVHVTSVLEYIVIFLAPKGDQSGTHYICRIHNQDLEALINQLNPTEIVNTPPFQLVMSGDNLGFGASLTTVSSVESNDEYYVYFVSNTADSPIRKINIKSNYGNVTYNLDRLNLFKTTHLRPMSLDVTAGSLKTGTYRYTYCLFEKNGSETNYATPTKPIYLTSDSLDSSSSSFIGCESEINSGKGVKLSVTAQNNYYIRIVRMYWADSINLPVCTIIYEGVVVDGKVNTIDDGTTNLGSVTIEDIATNFTSITAKQLASKNGMLLLGNIKEHTFDFDIDTRAYRYDKNGRIVLYDGSGTKVYEDANPPSNYKDYYECFNPHNNPFTPLSYEYHPKYKKNGTTIGGEGPVISFEFIYTDYKFTDSLIDNSHLAGTRYFFKLGNVRNSVPPQANIGYQRDEVYRFGIIFFTQNGQQTPVKWIEDIRFPDYWDFPIVNQQDKKYYRVLGIRFTIDYTKLPSNVTAYQIVRAVRTKSNSTVLDCGILSTFQPTDTIGVIRLGNFGANGDISSNMTKSTALRLDSMVSKWVDFISPETAYFKEYREKGDLVNLYPTRKVPKNVVIVSDKSSDETQWSSPVAVTILPDNSDMYKDVYTINDSYFFNYIRSDTHTVPLPFEGLQMYLYTAVVKKDINNRRGSRYSSMMLKLNNLISGWSSSNRFHPAYAVRKRFIYPYGGYSSSAKESTEYIPCTHVELKPNNVIDVYNGDTFVGIFEYMYAIHDNKTSAKHIQPVCVQAVVESRINLWYKGSIKVSDQDVGIVKKDSSRKEIFNTNSNEFAHWCMHEDSGVYPINNDETYFYTQPSNLYVYNSVYSLNDPRVYKYAKNTLSNQNTDFTYRIISSLKKYNSALSDTWSKLQLNNYIDLDPKYGQVNAIIDIRPGLLVFQDKAIAIVPIDERVLIPDQDSGGIVAGKSNKMDRYDYISTSYGTTTSKLVASTPSGVFFMDPREKIFGRIVDSFEMISRTGKIQSLLNKETFSGTLNVLYDDELEEVMFTVGDKSYLYSLQTGSFVSVLDSIYSGGTVHYNNTIGYATGAFGSNLYVLNRGNSGYYKTNVSRLLQPQRSRFVLRFSLAPNNGLLNRLDSLVVNGLSLDQNSQPSDYILNQLLVSNNYQSTGIIPLDQSNFEHRYRSWRINTIRESITNRFMIDYYHIIEFRLDDVNYTGEIALKSIFSDYKPVFNR